MPNFPALIYARYFLTIPPPSASFQDKTVIVTGGNTGIGYEAAIHIVRLGAAKVIIACRSIKKGEQAKASIEKATSCAPTVIDVWPLDLSSYASVKEFAARVNKELPRLDVVLENAGKGTLQFSTEEDNESTITVNVISTFLLALLLLPKLKESAAQHKTHPVLTVVTSELHGEAGFAERKAADAAGISWFDALADQKNAKMLDRYNVSKLLEVLVVQKLGASTGEGYPVTVNCVTPGFCHSELQREAGGVIAAILWLVKKALAKTAEEGSRIVVDATAHGAETHGKYLQNCQVAKTEGLTAAKDADAIRDKVWSELMERLEKIQPGITGNI